MGMLPVTKPKTVAEGGHASDDDDDGATCIDAPRSARGAPPPRAPSYATSSWGGVNHGVNAHMDGRVAGRILAGHLSISYRELKQFVAPRLPRHVGTSAATSIPKMLELAAAHYVSLEELEIALEIAHQHRRSGALRTNT